MDLATYIGNFKKKKFKSNVRPKKTSQGLMLPSLLNQTLYMCRETLEIKRK